jgi:hypothetical protein
VTLPAQKESPFRELSDAIFSGNVPGIHTWFKQVGFEPGSDLSAELCKYIVNSSYFFAFSSSSFDRLLLEKENLKRQLPVLSYFNLAEQLRLLSSVSLDRDIKIEHFKILNYSKESEEDKSLILKDLGMHHFFTNLFNKEEFNFMDAIEDMLGLDIKTNRKNNIAIHYEDPNKGAFNLNNKKYNSCPIDDIIFNYSETKAHFLKSKNIELPDFNYVNSLKEKILQEIKESSHFDATYSKKVEDKVDNYFINYRYKLLNKSIIPKNDTTRKANKI